MCTLYLFLMNRLGASFFWGATDDTPLLSIACRVAYDTMLSSIGIDSGKGGKSLKWLWSFGSTWTSHSTKYPLDPSGFQSFISLSVNAVFLQVKPETGSFWHIAHPYLGEQHVLVALNYNVHHFTIILNIHKATLLFIKRINVIHQGL